MPTNGLTAGTIFNNLSAGNVSASLLDGDFGQLFTAYNTLASAGNYFVDTGTPNLIVITVPAPLVASYVAGLPLQIRIANTNTGATTINVNGLGAVNLVYPNGAAALTSGQLQAGAIIPVQFDGTNFQYLGASTVSSSGTATLTASGFLGVVTYSLFYSVVGTSVTASIAPGNASSTAVTFTLAGVPAAIQPPTASVVVPLYAVQNNGTVLTGAGAIQIVAASGTWNVLLNANANGWTNGGVKGITGFTQAFAYPLQ